MPVPVPLMSAVHHRVAGVTGKPDLLPGDARENAL
jgi:hypothetical protein